MSKRDRFRNFLSKPDEERTTMSVALAEGDCTAALGGHPALVARGAALNEIGGDV